MDSFTLAHHGEQSLKLRDIHLILCQMDKEHLT